MSWTWEIWDTTKKIIHRDKNGRFSKDNFHLPKDWLKDRNNVGGKAGRKMPKYKMKEERKLHISLALKGRKLSKGHRMNISKGCKGIKPSEETKKKMSENILLVYKIWNEKHKEGIN